MQYHHVENTVVASKVLALLNELFGQTLTTEDPINSPEHGGIKWPLD